MVKTFSMGKGVAGPGQHSEKNKLRNPAAWASSGADDSRHNEDTTEIMTSGATITPS